MDVKSQNPLARRAFSSIASEGAGFIVSLGALGVMKGLAPNQLDRVKDVVARKVVMPWMEKARPWREMMVEKCEKSGNDAHPVCEKLTNPTPENEAWLQSHKPNITREERARERANELVDYGFMILPRLLTRLPLQNWADKKLGLDPVNFKQYGFAQVGDVMLGGVTLLGMNTIGHEQTRSMKASLSGVLQKMGMSQDMAGAITNYITYAQIPGTVGNLANAGILNNMARKAAEERAAEKNTTPTR